MPIRPPKMAFSNDDLVELEWVFASVCEALEANQDRQDEEAKACIRRRLFMLACNNGMSDPHPCAITLTAASRAQIGTGCTRPTRIKPTVAWEPLAIFSTSAARLGMSVTR